MRINRSHFAGNSVLVVVAMLAFMVSAANAQTTTATLTGTVADVSGAVVPGATVNLRNESSGDLRKTVSNGSGYFTFAAVPPGSYDVRVESSGFVAWEAKSVVLTAGGMRSVSGIKLAPSGQVETVEVDAAGNQITPVDSGEKSVVISEHVLQNVPIVGQNAAEFIKIMPGMAFTGGVVNQSSYQAADESTGHGPVGNFAANGQRTAALDITSDGAHIIDPGCNCGQAMNTNGEMTQELKVMTSNFGADEAKGPIVINAIGKSGGHNFHGEAYTYARYYSLNANDWLNNNAGLNGAGQPNAPKPQTKYIYPGFQIGGPVIIPKTGFNKNRDKMFFFFATQYYKQDVDNGVYHAVVPTAAMRNGDFSNAAYLNELNGGGVKSVPTGTGIVNGVIPQSMWDPNGLALMKVYPLANVDPAQNKGWNYVNSQTRFSNMLQFHGRLDYNFNDSTKLYVTYNRQRDNSEESADVLWTGNANSWASPTTPYPTPIVEASKSEVVTTNLTKVFNPTLTNELIFSWTFLNLPNSFQDPSKVDRAGLGLNYNMLFNHPNQQNLIFPQMTGWGDGIANMLNTGFELNGTVFAKKTLPAVSDNVSKVWGTHTSKFGFYWERAWNSQPGNGSVNGSAVFANWGAGNTNNVYANMLIGQMQSYTEQNFNTVPAFRYLSNEFYATDSWKVSHRITLDYGLRVSHMGPWVDTTGFGFAAWYPNLYSSKQGATVNGTFFPGIEWNKVNSSTPLSGSGSSLFFYSPRVGFAWNLYGNGQTVLRGGYGMYRFHDEQNVQNGAYGITQGSFTESVSDAKATFKALTAPTSTAAAPPGSVTVLDPNDTQQPRTQSYSLTLSQRIPWNSVLELSYVGNKSDYLSNWNNNFDQINDLGVNTLFSKYGWLPNCKTDPSQSGNCYASDANTGYTGDQINGTINNGVITPGARPLPEYANVKIIDHKMYSNYNSLQISWNKQSGPLTFLTNYTWSKSLGIRGEGGSATGDPTVLRNNYGTLPNNRAQIFNFAYVYQLPKLVGGNKFVHGALNGWQVSGVAQYQSGADLQASVSSNFGYQAYIPAGTTFMGKTLTKPILASAQNILGSGDITLMPRLTCDPRQGLAPHQYINPNCFAPFATPGQQGSYVFPTLTGPGYFDTDLSLRKAFNWGASDNKSVVLGLSGYNFLNHPNYTFINGDPGLTLNFDNTGKLVPQGTSGAPFGTATNKIGHRILQAMIRFSF
ncbi:MAG: carboxypeptidase-like regulatory domain-containing protein [Terriglobales bacterium]